MVGTAAIIAVVSHDAGPEFRYWLYDRGKPLDAQQFLFVGRRRFGMIIFAMASYASHMGK